MARIRTIKPEFWTSEQVVECSPTARLLFVGMWTFCDDGGNHPASLKSLKMQVFPGDDMTLADIGGFIRELVKNGLLREYSVSGCNYWHVTGWKHQKIEKPSYKYPKPFCTVSPTDRQPFDDYSPTDRQPFDGRPPAESSGEEGSLPESNVPESSSRGESENHNNIFKPQPEKPRRQKFPMTLDWQPSDQLRARAMPQGVNPDSIKPEMLAGFRTHYEAKELENNQGEWENLLIRWQKTQRDEPTPQATTRPAQQPTNDGPGWMALQPIKPDPKRQVTAADIEAMKRAREAAGIKS